MDTKLTNEELVAYLYGELSNEEKKVLEGRLQKDPTSASELKELEQLRGLVSQVKDKEVVDPFFYGTKSTGFTWQTARIIGNSILKPAIGLAASISLVILLGYLTQLNISNKDGYLSVNFGKPQRETTDQTDLVSREEVDNIIEEYLQKEQHQFVKQVEEASQKLDTRFASYSQEQNLEIKSAINKNTTLNNELVTQFITQMQNDNRKYLEGYFELASLNQQQYVQSLLTEFSDYLDEQRGEDLRQIQLSLSNLKDNQDVQKLETDQVLASIINTVNNQNNN